MDFSFKLFKNEVKEKVDHISTRNYKNYIKRVLEVTDLTERENLDKKRVILLEEDLRKEIEPEIEKILKRLK